MDTLSENQEDFIQARDWTRWTEMIPDVGKYNDGGIPLISSGIADSVKEFISISGN